MKPQLSHKDLVDNLHYDHETGEFTRLRNVGRHQSGVVVGTIGRNGYKYVSLNDQRHLSHRLVWFYVFGEWPIGVIDHIDMDPLNNRIGNLRDVSQATNMRNVSSPATPIGTSGFPGVTYGRASYGYQCRHNGTKTQKMGFSSASEAHHYWCLVMASFGLGDYVRRVYGIDVLKRVK